MVHSSRLAHLVRELANSIGDRDEGQDTKYLLLDTATELEALSTAQTHLALRVATLADLAAQSEVISADTKTIFLDAIYEQRGYR